MKFVKTALILTILLACNLALSAAIPAAERQALIDLYDLTNGASWTNKTNWLGAAGTENTWYGVTTDADNTTVLQLRLPDNNLVGTLPSSLEDLSNLQSLFLYSNQLTESIPSSLGNLSNLSALWISSNQLTGSIPTELGNLSNLQELYLSSNQLTGSIPTSLTNLTSLNSGSTDIGYNALYTSDATLIAFLDSMDPGWATTQTIAPSDVSAVPGDGSVTVSWTPIPYTWDTGGYRVYVAEEIVGLIGPYTLCAQTDDKTV